MRAPSKTRLLLAGLAFAGLAACSSVPSHRYWANDGYEPRPTAGVMVDGVGRVLDVRPVWVLDAERYTWSDRSWSDREWGRVSRGGKTLHVSAAVNQRFAGHLITDADEAAILADKLDLRGELDRLVEGQEVTVSTWDGRELRLVTFFDHEFSPGDQLTVQGRDSYYVLRPH